LHPASTITDFGVTAGPLVSVGVYACVGGKNGPLQRAEGIGSAKNLRLLLVLLLEGHEFTRAVGDTPTIVILCKRNDAEGGVERAEGPCVQFRGSALWTRPTKNKKLLVSSAEGAPQQ
jgi:hypothetical protein